MNWQIDYAHSEINFAVRQMIISKVRGRFEDWSGTVNFDPENLTDTAVDVTVKMSSVNTREQQRDACAAKQQKHGRPPGRGAATGRSLR